MDHDLVQTKDCRHGRLSYFAKDQFIGRVLDLYGEYSEGEVNVMQLALRRGDVAIEAGANIGALTVPLAKIVGRQGKVIAFEPQPRIFALLERNLAQNGLAWVSGRCGAAGSNDGVAFIDPPEPENEDNFGGVALQDKGTLRVPVTAIDSLRLPTLRFLKIDVEGMELDVLIGAEQTIERCRPVIYAECDKKGRFRPLTKFLTEHGYRMWWHLPLMYQANNFFGNPDNVFGNMISMNILAIAREEQIEIPALQEIIGNGEVKRDPTF